MHTRSIALALLAAGALASCKKEDETKSMRTDRVGAVTNVEGAKPNVRLIAPVPSGDWRLPAGDYAHVRFSPLAQINAGNAGNLKVITTLATGVAKGHEGGPLVVGDTMYVVTPFPNNLIAIDLRRPGGQLKFLYEPHPDPRSVGIACCDVVNRGATYADGKIVYNLLDDETVAVDAETGKQIWRTRTGNMDRGETTTMAALVVKDKVLVGSSGGELGVRGWLVALDLKTGKEVWRGYSTGPDSEVLIGANTRNFYKKDQGKDLGATTWPGEQWKLGGGNPWGWISYDPELNLVYYGTGNPGVWNPDLRPGDNKWSCSIFARNPDTGEVKWVYQILPHDHWDYDEIMENILLDMEFRGRMRKLLVHPARNGYVLVLDRETGELLSADKFVDSTNWATGYDLETGLPKQDPKKHTGQGKVVEHICPSSTGAKEFIPSAFSPKTGYLYIPAHNTCMSYEGIEANYIAGTPYLGADVKEYTGPGGFAGELIAWDLNAGKKVWGLRDDKLPIYSGVLATGGDLVFYGTMDGWFRAVDARNGNLLWQFHTESGIVGNAITYLGPDKKQYVAIYSGVGGWMGAVADPNISADDPYAALGVVGAMADIKRMTARGGALYVFGLEP
jgi:PQQ-dependent dehydrogenase (methanol/ethanol family)